MYFLPGDIAQIDGLASVRATPAGFTGGVQAGYDYQAGAVVYGLEADFDALELHDSRTVTEIYKSDGVTSFTLGQSFRTDWLFTLRPRIGWATEHYLIYGTAGVAATRLKYAETFSDNFGPAFESDSFSKTMVGWTVGAGAEYVLCDHWTVKGEYLYAAFGTMTKDPVLAVGINRDEFANSVSLTAHLIRLGLNYRF